MREIFVGLEAEGVAEGVEEGDKEWKDSSETLFLFFDSESWYCVLELWFSTTSLLKEEMEFLGEVGGVDGGEFEPEEEEEGDRAFNLCVYWA